MKNLFSTNKNFRKKAVLNWRMDIYDNESNFEEMADGYVDSSIKLIEMLLADNLGNEADIIIFPIIFLLNQSIELYLKVIARKENWVGYNVDVAFITHDIEKLYNDFENHNKGKDGFVDNFLVLKNYIDELKALVPVVKGKRDFLMPFRYTSDNKKNDYKYVKINDATKQNIKYDITIDLENLLDIEKEIKNTLSSYIAMLNELKEN